MSDGLLIGICENCEKERPIHGLLCSECQRLLLDEIHSLKAAQPNAPGSIDLRDHKMHCIRCDLPMLLDPSPHNPMSGISLLATGNWPSSVWDPVGPSRRAWFVLCDGCARMYLENQDYCMEGVLPVRFETFKPLKLDEDQ